jgi:fatty acid desaturase
MLNLRYSEDWRVLVWEVIYFAVSLYLWFQYDQLPYTVFVPLWFTATMFSFFGATITHNAIHVPLFRGGWQNAVFQVILSCTYGWPVSALIPGHNLSHHKFTNTAKDAMRPTKMRYQNNFWNYLLFPVATTRAIAKFDMEYMEDQKRKDRPIYRQYLLEAIVFYSWSAVMLFLNWRKYIVVWFIPQLYAKYQIIGMNTLQHDGCPTPQEDKYNHSRNFVGPIVNFFTFNNGYHAIHHMHPGLHWSKLAEEHQRVVKPNNHPNLNQENIFLYFWRVHVYPGIRLSYDGKPYVLPPDEPDQPWYNGTAETYSNAPSSLDLK